MKKINMLLLFSSLFVHCYVHSVLFKCLSLSQEKKKHVAKVAGWSAFFSGLAISVYYLNNTCGECAGSCTNCVHLLEGCASELSETRKMANVMFAQAMSGLGNFTEALISLKEAGIDINAKLQEVLDTCKFGNSIVPK